MREPSHEAGGCSVNALTATAAAAAPGGPSHLQSLLCSAAEHLAMRSVMRCEFCAPDGPGAEVTYIASLHLDPVQATAAVYVHHKASGRFVCRSLAAQVDEIDAATWSTDY